jgi:hypothetical protein
VLVILLEASNYARDLGCDEWDFAVEIKCLRDHWLSDNDIRWLVAKGYVAHARETTVAGDTKRQFRHGDPCIFSKRTAFVLTSSGQAFVESLIERAAEQANGQAGKRVKPSVESAAIPAASQGSKRDARKAAKPTWDRDRHELRVGNAVVKAYKVPSPNQETILSAFEEEGWPPRIDDPLPPHPELIAKRRLHDTIKALNRNQKNRLIHFLGDGTGEGIRWEFRCSEEDAPDEAEPAVGQTAS